MRYVLPSSREPSQIHKEQMMEEKIKWTDANQNIRLLRYDYPLAVGKRHIKNDVYDSSRVQEHLNYVTGNSSQADGNISMASTARRQRNLRCSSSIFSAPAYPMSSKDSVRVLCVCVLIRNNSLHYFFHMTRFRKRLQEFHRLNSLKKLVRCVSSLLLVLRQSAMIIEAWLLKRSNFFVIIRWWCLKK